MKGIASTVVLAAALIATPAIAQKRKSPPKPPPPAALVPSTASVALGCRTGAAFDAGAQAAMIDAFEADYPRAYRRYATLKRTRIAPDELRDTVTALACLAALPGAERSVPRMATPLFASYRHGRAAFAELDRVAIDPYSDANLRAVVRAFGAEMRFRVARREPI